ncbi:hypothetical protein AXX12_15525 [Anaerosporomusa subterranea]|uniref:YmaF family protein n=1 Tax=Anaerosporomusa subterranea TaxID=1794912 RepID=A0A154BN85_ANASB|nr:YmaF family protein [Anaerosporomusa subterranea]KYZ74988.1 hypothetical protein AXX12_15525 [Anaerosporomusa subterranea]
MSMQDEELLETREDRHAVHVHTYSTLTDVADRHQHVITSVSAPARDDDDSHIHRLRVRTSFVDEHWHWFDILTDVPTDMSEEMHTHYFEGETSVDDGHCHMVMGVTGLAPDEDDNDDC